jgi:hypothetical protein
VGHGTCSKAADFEAGLTIGMGNALDVALLGKLDFGFVPLSTDEVHDPRMIVVLDEFAEAMKRLARGFEVSDDTLPFDVVREVGPGGTFLGTAHTAEHCRTEFWTPTLFAGENLESWNAGPRELILDKARRKVLDVLDTYHPRAMKPDTEETLLKLVDGYAKKLGITGYKRPKLKG